MVHILDDLQTIRSIDASHTMDQMRAFVGNLSEAVNYLAPWKETPNQVCLSGIGGSAMAADILADLLFAESSVPVHVNRSVTLPRWMGKGDMSIVTSYSGNTQEALDVLVSGRKAGCGVCCITSGGKMLDMCQKDGLPHVKVPSGMQPRAALGYLLGAASAVLEAMGAGKPATEFRHAAANSASSAQRMGLEQPVEKNLAKKLALQLGDKTPILYAPRSVRSVAVRWQNQINENSKAVAFAGEVPEMNHNQMVGWLQGEKCTTCKPVFLLPSVMDPTVEKMTMVTIQMFTEHELDPLVIPLHGNTMAENLLSGIILGDHVSYYLAILKGVDPGPVPIIQEFKTRIA